MKKRELILDFTSLLDVILIMLFAIICMMGQVSTDAKNDAQAQREEAEGIREELTSANADLAQIQEAYDALAAENEDVQEHIEELEKENNELKAEIGSSDIDKKQLYDSLLEQATKFTLICEPYVNNNKSDSHAVDITIYSGEGNETQQELGIVTFTHNFSLTRVEREQRNAEMQADMYNALKKIVQDSESDLILISIQYTYNDKDFSQIDLDNINGAIEDVERYLSKTCYVDKIKK